MIDNLSAIVDYSTLILVKCLALWGECERNGRHYSRPADCTALGTAAMSPSAFEQSNADRNRLDRECCQSHLVASLGESWDRDSGALCWRRQYQKEAYSSRFYNLCWRERGSGPLPWRFRSLSELTRAPSYLADAGKARLPLV